MSPGERKTAERIPVVPAVLIWARETAGLSPETAAKRIVVSARSLEKWESGDLEPTITQLRKVSKVYKRPLAVLLLPTPAKDFSALRDFRRKHEGRSDSWSPELHAEYKRAISQREVFLELAELAPTSVPSVDQFVSITTDMSSDAAAARLRDALKVGSFNVASADQYEILNRWTDAVEAVGVIVIHTRGVGLKEMRGFSLSEWPFPVIALNGSDSPRGRTFTLFHEFAHLALNAGGLCDLHDSRRRVASEDQLEHFCNQVAASALMPKATVLAIPEIARASTTYAWSLDELGSLGKSLGVSAEATLLRLISLNKATWDLYRTRKPELEREYADARARRKALQKERKGGPNYYTVKARDLGHGYVSSVLTAYDSRAISTLDVADYLEVRFDQLSSLEKAVRS